MSLAFIVEPDLAPVIDRALELLFKRMCANGTRPPLAAVELQRWAQVVTRGLALATGGLPSDDAPVALLLTIPDVAAELGCGVTKVKKLITAGHLPTVDFDGVRRVRRQDLDAYIAGLPPGTFRDRIITKEAG